MYISVLVANYNNKEYIDECISSLINQSLDKSKYEIIVYDDASTDESLKLMEKYSSSIKIIKNNKNVGLSKARENLIKLSSKKATHIFFVDGDDWVHRDVLKELVKTTTEYPDKIASCGTLRKGKLKPTCVGGKKSIINVTMHSKLWPIENLINIEWPSRIKNEDDYALPWAIQDRDFVVNKKAIYYHRVVGGSLSTIRSFKNAKKIVDLAILNWPINNRNLSLLHHYASMEGAGRYYKSACKANNINRPGILVKIKYIGLARTFADFWTDILFKEKN